MQAPKTHQITFKATFLMPPSPVRGGYYLHFTEEETEVPGKQLIQSPTAPSCGLGPGWQRLVESSGFQMSGGKYCEEFLFKKKYILFRPHFLKNDTSEIQQHRCVKYKGKAKIPNLCSIAILFYIHRFI